MRDCATRDVIPADTTHHSLRHTGGLVGLVRPLGHSSIQTTHIYVQPTLADITERVNLIDLNAYAG